MDIQYGVAHRNELTAYDVSSSQPYSGGATVYALLRDVTNDTFWDNNAAAWVSGEPTLANNLPASGEGSGNFSFTIPAAAVPLSLAGADLRVILITTYTEASEVLISTVKNFRVLTTVLGASPQSWTPAVWNLLKYRNELILTLSRDATDEMWSNDDLNEYINRAHEEVYNLFAQQDPWRFVVDNTGTTLTFDPANKTTENYRDFLRVAYPDGVTADDASPAQKVLFPVRLLIDGAWVDPIEPKQRFERIGFWIEGANIVTNRIPGSSVTGVLWYVPVHAEMTDDVDTDSLQERKVRQWIVPVARTLALEREDYANHEKFITLLDKIETYLRDKFPHSTRVVEEVSIGLGHLDGFAC